MNDDQSSPSPPELEPKSAASGGSEPSPEAGFQATDGTQVPPQGAANQSKTPITADREIQQWMMFAHLFGLFGILGPAIVLLVKKDENPIIVVEAKESLNFQIAILIGYAVASLLATITCGILIPLCFVPTVFATVFCIIAALEANKGIPYRYPFSIRVLT